MIPSPIRAADRVGLTAVLHRPVGVAHSRDTLEQYVHRSPSVSHQVRNISW
jgi:hypothetical protein